LLFQEAMVRPARDEDVHVRLAKHKVAVRIAASAVTVELPQAV